MNDSKNSEEFWIRERCFVRERVNAPSIPEFSLADCRVEPGVTTELHSLNVAEWYLIMAGHGKVEVGGSDAREVAPGDTVTIPRGESQRITNIGEGDLVFQCICIPRFTVDGYAALE